MKPYPKYKDSGIEWLGEIPEHWKTVKLSRGYNVVLGKMLQNNQALITDQLKPYIRAANISWGGVIVDDIKEMWFSIFELTKYRLRKGDLLISEGGDVGRSCNWDNEIPECYIQNAINRIRAVGQNDTRFLYYYIAEIKQCGYIDIVCNKSTISHFTAEKVSATPIPLPPLPEQKAIATFLDRETQKIDHLIAKQELMIALLEEKRQALISHAVTKGLNTKVKMKDSGIEWLGDIPEHWEVKRLKYLADCMPSNVDKKSYEGEMSVKLCNYTDVYYNENITSKIDFMIASASTEQIKKFSLKEGDVIITKDSEDPTDIAVPAYVSEDLTNVLCGYHLALIRANASSFGLFIKWFFKSNYANSLFATLANGLTRYGIGTYAINNGTFTLPPLPEQKLINEFINVQTERFDRLKEKAQSVIDLLKEKRSSLISAAVTGKIDVRETK